MIQPIDSTHKKINQYQIIKIYILALRATNKKLMQIKIFRNQFLNILNLLVHQVYQVYQFRIIYNPRK